MELLKIARFDYQLPTLQGLTISGHLTPYPPRVVYYH